jgi:hypothetical protein
MLLSQYLPEQYEAVREGQLANATTPCWNTASAWHWRHTRAPATATSQSVKLDVFSALATSSCDKPANAVPPYCKR